MMLWVGGGVCFLTGCFWDVLAKPWGRSVSDRTKDKDRVVVQILYRLCVVQRRGIPCVPCLVALGNGAPRCRAVCKPSCPVVCGKVVSGRVAGPHSVEASCARPGLSRRCAVRIQLRRRQPCCSPLCCIERCSLCHLCCLVFFCSCHILCWYLFRLWRRRHPKHNNSSSNNRRVSAGLRPASPLSAQCSLRSESGHW